MSAGVRFMGDGFAQFNLMQGDESIDLNISISFRGSQLAASLLSLVITLLVYVDIVLLHLYINFSLKLWCLSAYFTPNFELILDLMVCLCSLRLPISVTTNGIQLY